MVINLNKQLSEILYHIDINNKPNLFLHVCCAPCSSAVLYKLFNYFNLYIIFYNSNIDTKEEFIKRYNELLKLNDICKYNLKIIYNDYKHDEFLDVIKGFESEPECGKRCEKCYRLRLSKSYDIAYKYILDNKLENNYLCTTLSISPHKDALLLENIGEEICNQNNGIIKYLPSDFKKEDGYLNSIRLSKEYKLYRQDYCGCEFAKMHN